jgi:hypothetical protein
MKKLTLNVDALEVQSFATVEMEAERGTVQGQQQCTCYTCTCPGCATCYGTCPNTCAVTCPNTCWETCDDASCYTCWSCYGGSCDYTCATGMCVCNQEP